MKYQLLALDVDGTLVTPDQRIPPDVVEAIAAASAGGLRVCIATGRSFVETMPVWRQLRLATPYEPMVLIGGALVAEPDTGRTLYQRTIPMALACEYADALGAEGHSACAIVDAWRHGMDYYMAESADSPAVRTMWFDKMNVKIRSVPRFQDVPDMPPPLRVNAVVPAERGGPLAERLRLRFDGRLTVHSILAPNYGATVVEAFAPAASKWSGIMYLAQAHRIGPAHIAAVGDDINDLPMIRAAGLGVAVANATPTVRDAARHVATEGLAQFIRDLTAGKFDQ